MPLQEKPIDAAAVVDELARLAEPGLMAIPSGRFFGWVMGGTLPAAMAADWLVSAWDQNAALRYATPATSAAEETAGRWLLDLLGLPAGSDVGFTTGATGSNFVGLAAARQFVLQGVGWDVAADGLSGAPRINVFVGRDRHASVDLALKYLGLGRPIEIAADPQGTLIPGALAEAMDAVAGPAIVCLQAGTCIRGPATLSRKPRPLSTTTGHGCTWTAPLACGRRRAAGTATWWRDWRTATRGPRMRTRPSMCPMTAAWPSFHVPRRCARSSACTPATWCVTTKGRGTRLKRCPNFPAAPGACPSGRRCVPWAPREWKNLLTGWCRRPRPSAGRSPACPASKCSTMWSSPRCASVLAPMGGPGTSPNAVIANGTAWMSGSHWARQGHLAHFHQQLVH